MNRALTQIGRRAVPPVRPDDSQDWPVALVSMPFMNPKSPSIQLGLLKAIADAHGFPATTMHLNLDFAAQIGFEAYLYLCATRAMLATEWLFSPAALGDEAPDLAGDFLTQKEKQLRPFLEEGGITLEGFRAWRDEAVPRYRSVKGDRLLRSTLYLRAHACALNVAGPSR